MAGRFLAPSTDQCSLSLSTCPTRSHPGIFALCGEVCSEVACWLTRFVLIVSSVASASRCRFLR